MGAAPAFTLRTCFGIFVARANSEGAALRKAKMPGERHRTGGAERANGRAWCQWYPHLCPRNCLPAPSAGPLRRFGGVGNGGLLARARSNSAQSDPAWPCCDWLLSHTDLLSVLLTQASRHRVLTSWDLRLGLATVARRQFRSRVLVYQALPPLAGAARAPPVRRLVQSLAPGQAGWPFSHGRSFWHMAPGRPGGWPALCSALPFVHRASASTGGAGQPGPLCGLERRREPPAASSRQARGAPLHLFCADAEALGRHQPGPRLSSGEWRRDKSHWPGRPRCRGGGSAPGLLLLGGAYTTAMTSSSCHDPAVIVCGTGHRSVGSSTRVV